jgi:putative salt-induced outer membrane protein YdiY
MKTRTILSALPLALFVGAAALADSITLTGGDVLRGTIVSESDASVTLDHAALGRIEVARSRIASIEKSPAAAAPAAPAAPAAAAPVKPVAVLPAPVPPAPEAPAKPDGSWKFALSLGLSGSKNDESSNWDFRTAGEAKREDEDDRTTLTAEYFYKRSDGVETDNNILVKALEEFLYKDSRWELFVQGTYQNDNYQAWEQRAGLYAGPGYRLIEGEPLSLKLRGGAGASYEFPTETWTPEAFIANDLVWKIDERSSIKQGLELYPDLEQTGEYRLIARIDYEIALNAKNDLFMNAGVRDEYDSYVEPTGDSTNDIKVYVGVKAKF